MVFQINLFFQGVKGYARNQQQINYVLKSVFEYILDVNYSVLD